MKNAALAILSLVLAAALTFGVVTRKNLSETRDSLESERASRLSITRELESTLEDSESCAGEVERLQTELSRAEAAEAEAQERLESIENRYREQTALLSNEIDSLKAQRDQMEAEISAIRLECASKSAGLEDALRLRAEEVGKLKDALAQARQEAAGIETRAASEKAAMAEEIARLQEKTLSSTEVWERRLGEMKEELSRLSASEQEKRDIEALLEEERAKSRMLADECGALEKTVELLRKDVEEKEEARRLLSSQLKEEREKIATLLQEHALMNQTLVALKEELAEGREAFSALAEDRRRGEMRMVELEQELREALGSLARLEETIMDTSSTMEDLRRQTLELRKKAQQKDREIETVRSTYETLVTDLRRELERKEVRIERIKDMISLEVVDNILFPPGRATITPEGKSVLLKVGDVLKTVKDRPVRVVGHTDNIPIRVDYRSIYPTNWELSAARACSVVRYFQHRTGLPPSRLEPVGRSFYEPVAGNDSPEGRALNRRVAIIIGPRLDIP